MKVNEGKGAVPTFQRHSKSTPVIDIGYIEIIQVDLENKGRELSSSVNDTGAMQGNGTITEG